MSSFDDDSDFGTIVFAVLATTLVLGSFIYLYNSGSEPIQTAYRFPITIDKTVPSIVPSQPQNRSAAGLGER